nr:hypothetical protein [Tanacetum cinerariifolium]
MVNTNTFLETNWSGRNKGYGHPKQWYQSKYGKPLRKRLQQEFIKRQIRREKEAKLGKCIRGDTRMEEDWVKIKGIPYSTKVNTFNEFVAFLNLIKRDEIVSQEWDIFRKKFDKMVKWFYNYYLDRSLPVPIPPTIKGVQIHLFDLYKLVEGLGGYLSVCFGQEFGIIGEILGLAKENGEEIKRCYINYLDVLTSYYKTAMGFNLGRMIHGDVVKMGFDVSSVFVGNSLLSFYGKCGLDGVDYACKVFDDMYVTGRDVVSWNTMIAMYMDSGQVGLAVSLFEEMTETSVVTWNCVITGLAKNGKMEFASSLFDKMPIKDEVSWNCLISGYVKAGDLRSAEIMFEAMPVKSVVTCTAIISGYASNGDVEAARKLFDRMGDKRNIVTWNAMIAGYVNKSIFDEALSLFHLMLLDGKCRPDQVTLISVLSACSHLGSLENGKWISSYINKNKIDLSISLGNALIDMFAKCGDVESSKTVFSKMPNRCIITWTTMVSGLAVNGMCKEALALFNQMCVQGTKPDDVMFIAVLSACNHGRLVEEGKSLFTQMVYEYGIKPQIEHYGCMIDLLARSGDLDEAVRLTESMDMLPNAVIWGTLIAACKQGIEKVPGCSSIEIGDSVHEFLARDTSHMQRSDVYETLQSLNGQLWSDLNFEGKLVLCCTSHFDTISKHLHVTTNPFTAITESQSTQLCCLQHEKETVATVNPTLYNIATHANPSSSKSPILAAQYEQTSSFITTMTKTEPKNTKVLPSLLTPTTHSLEIRPSNISLPTFNGWSDPDKGHNSRMVRRAEGTTCSGYDFYNPFLTGSDGWSDPDKGHNSRMVRRAEGTLLVLVTTSTTHF